MMQANRAMAFLAVIAFITAITLTSISTFDKSQRQKNLKTYQYVTLGALVAQGVFSVILFAMLMKTPVKSGGGLGHMGRKMSGGHMGGDYNI